MSKIVIELQKDIIENKMDIVSILRKGKLIAAKLNLNDFSRWLDLELNGYSNYSDIPEYRMVIGEIKAKSPYYGLIPVMMSNSISEQLNKRKLFNSISELLSLSEKQGSIIVSLPGDISKALCENSGVNYPCYFVFGNNYLIGIINNVKNRLLEWCLKLEKVGVLGEEYEFNENEIEQAKKIPQDIDYYIPIK